MKKQASGRVEIVLSMIILLMCIAIWVINPRAMSLPTLFNMLRSYIVSGIFALGVLMVLISGGMDVSFTYIAAVAAYATVVVLHKLTYTGTILLPFLIAAILGAAMGGVNGWLIGRFNFPALIVTLGTGTAFHGFAVCFVGTTHITNLPGKMVELSKSNLVTLNFADGSKGGVNLAILVTAAVLLLGYFLLNKTMWGRGIYAIGGAKSAAACVGYNVPRILLLLYVLVGAISGIAGIIFMGLNRQANPHLMVGTELDVIAAVVLGGASVFGGRGTILGTMLGVGLVTILNNSLILVGIPTQWQSAFMGIMILLGTTLPIAMRSSRGRRTKNDPQQRKN